MRQYHGVSRRSFLRVSLAAATLTILRSAGALSATPRQRVILDNDFWGDPDGLFQLAHHLTSPSVETPLVIGSHIHLNDFLDKTTTQPRNAVAKVQELYATMTLERRIGGMEYADLLPSVPPRRHAEYNLTIDLAGAQFRPPLRQAGRCRGLAGGEQGA